MVNGIEESPTHNLSVYVANRPGVLARVAQVFSRRGYNIDSLVVSPSVNGHYSRMTITAKGSREGLDQVIRQLSKLIDVLRCVEHIGQDSVVKEMALIKLGVGQEDRTAVLQIAQHYGAKTVDLTDESIVLLCTGNSDKLDSMIEMLGR